MSAKESILWKIKKLLNLADTAKNSNIEEATSAGAKAQEILFKYNLELADVQGLSEEEAETIDRQNYTVQANRNTITWKGSLLHGVCLANFCRTVRLRSNSGQMAIFGKPSNVQVAVYLFEYLQREIERLAIEGLQAQGVFTGKARWLRSFCLGAMSSVCRRLHEQKEQDRKASHGGTALVVVSDRELEKAVRSEFPILSKGRSTTIGDSSGYSSGREAGNGIALRRGMTGGTRREITH
jgi:hypothetical protein